MKYKIDRFDKFIIEIEAKTKEEALEKAYEEDDSNYQYEDCDYEIRDTASPSPLSPFSQFTHYDLKEVAEYHGTLISSTFCEPITDAKNRTNAMSDPELIRTMWSIYGRVDGVPESYQALMDFNTKESAEEIAHRIGIYDKLNIEDYRNGE